MFEGFTDLNRSTLIRRLLIAWLLAGGVGLAFQIGVGTLPGSMVGAWMVLGWAILVVWTVALAYPGYFD